MRGTTSVVEDYLQVMHYLTRDGYTVIAARLAERLNVSPPTVTATLQRNPNVDAESVLLRLLELPAALFEREGTTSLVVFDEIQDVLAVPGADGKIRSVIQHQAESATYGFAGSAPGVMQPPIVLTILIV